MKQVIFVLLLFSAVVSATEFDRHALTMSVGIPGLLLPELAYEFSLNANNKIGIAAGSFFIVPEYRLIYTRMVQSLELQASFGRIGDFEDGDGTVGGFYRSVFESGAHGLKFFSVTGGYRHTAGNGFMFRIAGGGGCFIESEEAFLVPFVQTGIGYSF